MDLKVRATEQALENEKRADFRFIETRTVDEAGLLKEKSQLSNLQGVQVKRLDQVDKLLGDDGGSKGAETFLGMAALGFYFESFAKEMLTKPSKATTLIDLQEELLKGATYSNSDDVEMNSDSISGGGYSNQRELFEDITQELAKSFSTLFQ